MKTTQLLILPLAVGLIATASLNADFLKLSTFETNPTKQNKLKEGKVPAGEAMSYLQKLEKIFSENPVLNMQEDGYYAVIEIDDSNALALQCKMQGDDATCSVTRMRIDEATNQIETLRPLSSAGPSGKRPVSTPTSPLATQSSSKP